MDNWAVLQINKTTYENQILLRNERKCHKESNLPCINHVLPDVFGSFRKKSKVAPANHMFIKGDTLERRLELVIIFPKKTAP